MSIDYLKNKIKQIHEPLYETNLHKSDNFY